MPRLTTSIEPSLNLFAPHRPNGIRPLDWLVGKRMAGERSGGNPTHNTCILSSEMQYKIEITVSIGVLNVTSCVSFRRPIWPKLDA
jgi:hypothetical protein